MRQRRISSRPSSLVEFRIIRTGRVALRTVRAACKHLGEPMLRIGGASPECHKSGMRLLPRRRAQGRHHSFARGLRPLCRFVGQHQDWRQTMRPARIGADAPHPCACLAILDSGLLRCIPNFPARVIVQLLAHECENMLKADSRLLEARSHDHGLATRHRERSIQGRRRDPREQRGLAVASADAQGRRLDARREGAAHKPPLPRQHGERLSGETALRDG